MQIHAVLRLLLLDVLQRDPESEFDLAEQMVEQLLVTVVSLGEFESLGETSLELQLLRLVRLLRKELQLEVDQLMEAETDPALTSEQLEEVSEAGQIGR